MRPYPPSYALPAALAVFALLASVPDASAAMVLEIRGIAGNAATPRYENSIAITSFQTNGSRNVQNNPGGSSGSPLLSLSPVALSKEADPASSALVEAMNKATRLQDWKLTILTEGSNVEPRLTLELCDVYIVGFATAATSYSYSSPSEAIQFAYGGYRLGIYDLNHSGPGEAVEYIHAPSDTATCTVGGSPNPVDTDGDGLTDEQEAILGTNPNSVDTDRDGLVDGAGGIVLLSAYPAGIDLNGDGFVDGEADYGTNPTKADTDKDTFSDGVEVIAGSNPLRSDSIPPLPVIPGDVNLDGAVNLADLLTAQQLLLGQIPMTAEVLVRGDVAPLVGTVSTPDGVFNAGDVLVIQSWVLKPSP